jgi:hypothetical protein
MPWSRARRIALAVPLLLGGGFLLGYVYFRARGNSLLQSNGQAWLAQRLSTLSDSVYDARLHRLRYEPATRSLRFDSLVVTTRVVHNQKRLDPLPTLTFSVHRGRVTGLSLWEALLGHRIRANEVGFDSVTAIVVLPAIFRDSTGATRVDSTASEDPIGPSSASTLVVVGGVPAGVRARALAMVKRVRFENIRGRLVIPLEERLEELELNNLSLELDDVAFDARRDAATPFHVKDIRVDAHDFSSDVGSSHLAFAGLSGSFADSALVLDSLHFTPKDGDAGYMKGRRYRGTRAQLGFGRMQVAGLDWNGLIRSSGLAVRRVEVERFELDLLLDKRLPANPVHKPRLYVQKFVQRLRTTVSVDSILLRDARVQYAEHAPGAAKAGRLRFEHINGSIANLSNDPRRQTDSTPLRLSARAKLMGSGTLDAVIELPLLADGLYGRYRAELGPMDASELNELVTPLMGIAFKSGALTSLVLAARVRDGVYDGTLVPQFRDLGIDFPQSAAQKKREGGIGGFFKGIGRGVKEIAANTAVRDNNPAKPGEKPVTGHVHFVRRPWDSFWSGIWQSLKPALKESIVNIDV